MLLPSEQSAAGSHDLHICLVVDIVGAFMTHSFEKPTWCRMCITNIFLYTHTMKRIFQITLEIQKYIFLIYIDVNIFKPDNTAATRSSNVLLRLLLCELTDGHRLTS